MDPQYQFDEKEENVFTIEPAHLTDFTIHFQSASFHVHKLTLPSASRYFNVILASSALNEQCQLTDQYQQPGHRCVSLPDSSIGGTEVTAEQLHSFLEHPSYSVNRSHLIPWRNALIVGDLVDYQDSSNVWKRASILHIDSQCVSVQDSDANTYSVSIDSSRLQQAYSMSNEPGDKLKWLQSIQKDDLIVCVDTQRVALNACVIENTETRVRVHYMGWGDKWDGWIDHTSSRLSVQHGAFKSLMDIDCVDRVTGLHLAHYFECPKILQYYHDNALHSAVHMDRRLDYLTWELFLTASLE